MLLDLYFRRNTYFFFFSLMCMVEGILLLVIGNKFLDAPATILSVAMLICGLVILVNGIVLCINTGIYTFRYLTFALYIVPSVLMLYSSGLIKFAAIAAFGMCGLMKIYDGIVMSYNRNVLCVISFVFGIASIVAAFCLLLMQPLTKENMHIVLGILLIVNSITDCISGLTVAYSEMLFLKNNS